MTTTIRSRLLTPSGVPVRRRAVTARLIAPAAWLADHSGQVIAHASAATDGGGWWELELTPQSAYAAVGGYYEITDPATTHACVVPDEGPVLLGDILVDPATLDPLTPDAPALFLARTELGEPDGVAPLDANGLVPASHLPSEPDLIAELLADDWEVAHRGGGDLAPEHTMAAYEQAVAAGARAIEVSVLMTADGVLVCGHDTTIDRVTNGTGTYNTHTYAGLRAHPVDMRQWLGPTWGTVAHTPLREVLDRFLGRVVIFLEPKVGAAHAPMMALLDEYPHPQRSVVYKAYRWGANQDDAKARGYRVWSFGDADDPLAEYEALIDSGADLLGVPYRDDISGAPSMSDADIAAVVGLDVPVMVWPISRRWSAAHLRSLGVQGLMCSGWRYITHPGPILTADNIAAGIRAPGDLPRTHRPEWQPSWDSDEIVLDQSATTGYMLGSLGSATPPASYTLRFDIAFTTIPGDGNAHSGIAFAKTDDSAFSIFEDQRSGGYHVVLRADGRLQLYRHDPGPWTSTQLATATDTAPQAGAYRRYEVTVSPTEIALQRISGTPSTLISTSDTTYRGGYTHVTKNWGSGTAGPVRYRNITVT